MILYNTIQNNFTTLLRAGTFNITGTQLQPMSLYKWRRLLLLASQLGVSGYISTGLHLMKHDIMLPKEIITETEEEDYDFSQAKMFNYFKQKRFVNILNEERHAIDTSLETMELLRILVSNANDITTSDIDLNGIIAIGRYLRAKGDKVDFVKLSEWIHRLGIEQVVSMIGSLLIDLFDFEIQELEIIKRLYVNTLSHYNNLLYSTLKGQDHHFKTSSRINIAMMETASYHIGMFTSKIRNIEE